jgi:hypothetical protein
VEGSVILVEAVVFARFEKHLLELPDAVIHLSDAVIEMPYALGGCGASAHGSIVFKSAGAALPRLTIDLFAQ